MSPDASSPLAPPSGGPEVDAQHPWLGLASFSEETRGYFYGREGEVAELARRVQRKLLTILFGQSGLGKTSILRAGIVPRLRPEGYCPVYVRIDYARESPPPAEQIKQAIFKATQAQGAWTRAGVAVGGESLWEFLHHRDDVLVDGAGRKLVPLLIFDQFEEIFTLAQSDEFGRRRSAQFLEDLADLVENRAPRSLELRIENDEALSEKFDFERADYRILIALREDYLAHLESLKPAMPSVTQNRMRLARMTGGQALEAVQKPGGSLVSQDVAEAIVRFVAGGAEIPNAEVEPSLLSLICRELNNARIAAGHDEISAAVLAGSRDTILTEFYERALAGEPAGVRQVIEEHLLTESGHRESIAEERLQRQLALAGGAPETLARLVDRRLLRVEERLDVRRVELTHDVLCGVVKASRDVRLEREARDEAERRLAAQRERERATRAALVRARKIAAACAVLALVAVAGAVFGWISMKRAQDAEAKADDTRMMAEAARGESEKLVAYLLEDFQLELAPIGRLDVVAGLAKRAIDYYNGLPAPLRTPQTERNRALALVRYGTAMRTQSRLDEARKSSDEAIAVLSRLREQGDRTETTAIGLTLGLHAQARIASSIDDGKSALAAIGKAAEIIRPVASAPSASVESRRTYGDVMNLSGYLQMQDRQYDASLASLAAARDTYRSIDGLSYGDLGAAAAYAESTAWIVQTLVQASRDGAESVSKEAVDVAAKVLEKRPGHMQALRAQGLATAPLARQFRDEGRFPEALAACDANRRVWQEFVRLDPGNGISWHNLGVSYLVRGEVLHRMGRLSDAAANQREVLRLERDAPPNNVMLLGQLSLQAGRLAMFESMLGRPRETAEALSGGERLRSMYAGLLPAGSFRRASAPVGDDFWRMVAQHSAGDYARAIETGRAYVAKMQRLAPADDSERRDRAEWLGYTYIGILVAAFSSGDDATVEWAWPLWVENQKVLPPVSVEERHDAMGNQVIYAATLARRGRQPEAAKLVDPPLAYLRDRYARTPADTWVAEDYARALYVAALAGSVDRRMALAQAGAILERLPAESRRAARITTLSRMIAEERARAR